MRSPRATRGRARPEEPPGWGSELSEQDDLLRPDKIVRDDPAEIDAAGKERSVEPHVVLPRAPLAVEDCPDFLPEQRIELDRYLRLLRYLEMDGGGGIEGIRERGGKPVFGRNFDLRSGRHGICLRRRWGRLAVRGNPDPVDGGGSARGGENQLPGLPDLHPIAEARLQLRGCFVRPRVSEEIRRRNAGGNGNDARDRDRRAGASDHVPSFCDIDRVGPENLPGHGEIGRASCR